jgi:hypothetical protein
MCSTWVGTSLTYKHYIRLEWPITKMKAYLINWACLGQLHETKTIVSCRENGGRVNGFRPKYGAP